MSTRVLIVDDAAFMRQTIRMMLTGMGFDVVGEAADGVEACRRFVELKPDVVTMDVVMPGISGVEALQRIREHDASAKVVMITADDHRASIIEAFRLGAMDYIVKPFEKERVEEAMQRVVAV